MALGRRCDIGCEDWPDDAEYRICPQCGEPTKAYSNLAPLSKDEARSKRLHLEFEDRYENRCIALGVPVEGELPADYRSEYMLSEEELNALSVPA